MEITAHLAFTDGCVKVKVTDLGIGLKEEEHHKVFQKFYRADAAPKNVAGFGSGLFLCSEIIMRHGGQIGIETPEEGQAGTCFFYVSVRPSRSTIADRIAKVMIITIRSDINKYYSYNTNLAPSKLKRCIAEELLMRTTEKIGKC